MPKQTLESLTKSLPAGVKPDAAPEWLKTIDKIVTGVNDMLETYTKISGTKKDAPVIEHNADEKPLDFAAARVLKKAEMARKKGEPVALLTPPEEGDKMPNEFKELIDGAIKTLTAYSGMGKGEEKIGKAILDLPVTVDQLQVFLVNLRAKKYG